MRHFTRLTAVFLGLLILELSIVYDFADRGDRIGGYFYEVKRTLACQGDSVLREHECVFAVIPDQPYLARPDSFVYTIVLANMFSPFGIKCWLCVGSALVGRSRKKDPNPIQKSLVCV